MRGIVTILAVIASMAAAQEFSCTYPKGGVVTGVAANDAGIVGAYTIWDASIPASVQVFENGTILTQIFHLTDGYYIYTPQSNQCEKLQIGFSPCTIMGNKARSFQFTSDTGATLNVTGLQIDPNLLSTTVTAVMDVEGGGCLPISYDSFFQNGYTTGFNGNITLMNEVPPSFFKLPAACQAARERAMPNPQSQPQAPLLENVEARHLASSAFHNILTANPAHTDTQFTCTQPEKNVQMFYLSQYVVPYKLAQNFSVVTGLDYSGDNPTQVTRTFDQNGDLVQATLLLGSVQQGYEITFDAATGAATNCSATKYEEWPRSLNTNLIYTKDLPSPGGAFAVDASATSIATPMQVSMIAQTFEAKEGCVLLTALQSVVTDDGIPVKQFLQAFETYPGADIPVDWLTVPGICYT